MEPGHEDREYAGVAAGLGIGYGVPQWSPVMKTGNTGLVAYQVGLGERASMEPGHEDREYLHVCQRTGLDPWGLNGARS